MQGMCKYVDCISRICQKFKKYAILYAKHAEVYMVYILHLAALPTLLMIPPNFRMNQFGKTIFF